MKEVKITYKKDPIEALRTLVDWVKNFDKELQYEELERQLPDGQVEESSYLDALVVEEHFLGGEIGNQGIFIFEVDDDGYIQGIS